MSEIKDDLDTLSEMVKGKESSFFSTEGFNGNEISWFIYGKNGATFWDRSKVTGTYFKDEWAFSPERGHFLCIWIKTKENGIDKKLKVLIRDIEIPSDIEFFIAPCSSSRARGACPCTVLLWSFFVRCGSIRRQRGRRWFCSRRTGHVWRRFFSRTWSSWRAWG